MPILKRRNSMNDRKTGTFGIPTFIIDKYLPTLSRHAVNILIYLYGNADANGVCEVSHTQLAKGSNVPKSNMRRYTRILQELKLIEREYGTIITSKGRNIINRYTLVWFNK